ncbi:MAG: N-acetylmuramoyl-L-alanine amidase [Muribaculaceae bacterium]|nr:N-acetylmuramoyl-L-alanine amidase [Muribaculaceae bacterium]
MKKVQFAALMTLLAISSASAQSLQGKKIYINPGHGGFEASQGVWIPGEFANGFRPDGSNSTDRWNATIPYPSVCEDGCWESKHNLWRGLELQRLLEAAGADVMMSRTQNRPEDDRILTTIGSEATDWQADMFVSIHSNGNGSNHLMVMYRGADPVPGQPFNINDPAIPESKVMGTVAWRHLHDNGLTCWQSMKDPASPYVVSDSAFYSSWTNGYHLGVFRNMWRPGFLAEIGFHDYKPEAHRMLSEDYSKIVAYQLYTGICEYFDAPQPATGIIAGAVKDAKRIFRDPLYLGATFGDHDQYKPVNGAKVTLSGNGVNLSYTTDSNYNGLFYFPDLAPGSYRLVIEAEGYTPYEEDVVCEAAKVRGPIAMIDDPDYDPASASGRANVYASALEPVQANSVRFTLNDDATSVTINLIKDDKVVKSIDLGPQARGTNTVSFDSQDVADGEYAWSITASADPITGEPVQFSVNGDPMLEIANTRSVAVDRNQASPWFGRVYATSVAANGKTGRRLGTGIYVLDAALTDVEGQGDTPWQGGQTWSGNSSPMRVAVAEDGNVYVCDWSDGHSGVWVIDPADPAEFRAVFGGTRNSNGLASEGSAVIHGSIVDLCLTGSGAGLQLYTDDEDLYPGGTAEIPTVDKSFITRYDLGESTSPWVSEPSYIYPLFMNNGVNKLRNQSDCIEPDGRGGLWVGQNRDTNSDGVPSLLHLNAKGEFDYYCGDASMIKTSGPMGALGVNADGSLIAVAGKSDIRVLAATYDENGKPSLTIKYTMGSTYGARPFDCDFDAADNLYIAYNDNQGGIAVWGLPKEKNEYTTVANAPLRMTSGVFSAVAEEAGITLRDGIVSAAGAVVELYDVAGNKVARGYAVDLGSLATGVYVARSGAKTLKVIK